MKIEIDLTEVFEDEEGGVFRPDVKDIIIQGVIDKIVMRSDRTIGQTISTMIQDKVSERVTTALDAMILNLMDYEFTETGGYGASKEPTTVKNRILNDIQKNMVWRDGHYESDQSPYTKALKKVVEEKLKGFSKEWVKEIDSKFMAECLDLAQKKLQERLGIK